MNTQTKTPQIDRERLRRKYLEERNKRIRPDGADQYLEPVGKFAYLEEDPYTPPLHREPLTDHVTCAIVGGGFSGLCTGARLREAGIDDFRIIEGGGDFGGVWYWNRYPGAMCDTAAMVYLPLLEETGYMPTRKYVHGREIWEHAARIARRYQLYDNALFSTRVHTATWDEAHAHWVIETNRGDRMTAKYITLGIGPLSRPKLPGIPGIETFSRQSFHTSRWNYDYTGGNWAGGPLRKLHDKRVGVIGTGATAVQCIPPLGESAAELFVFQRTPSAVDERNNQPIDPDWYSGLESGWQKRWMINFATLLAMGSAEEDLVRDGWTDIGQRIRRQLIASTGEESEWSAQDILSAYEDSDDVKTEEIRRRVDAVVADERTADELKAWYRQWCKRPCFHDEYLPTFNRPNVHLIDTDGRGVERIDETGVWANGQHYELDCLIYASGFEFNTDYTRRAGFEIVGRSGVTLTERWANGMESFQGMHVHGFPNMFIVGFVQGANLGANLTSNLSEAAITIAKILRHAEGMEAARVECTQAAERDWVHAIENDDSAVLIGGPDCTPGYYNNEGNPHERRHKLNTGGYPAGAVAFFEYIEDWRTNGRFEGLRFD